MLFPFSKLIPLKQGQCFVAINPSAFAPGFEDRLQVLMDNFRNLQPVRTLSFSDNYEH